MKMTSEDDAEFEAFAEELTNKIGFMMRDRKFGKRFPKLQKRILELNRKALTDLDADPDKQDYPSENDDEDEGTKPLLPGKKEPIDAANAQKTFNAESGKLLRHIAATKFGIKPRTK